MTPRAKPNRLKRSRFISPLAGMGLAIAAVLPAPLTAIGLTSVSLTAIVLTSFGLTSAGLTSAAQADDSWRPFADQDRNDTARTRKQRRRPARRKQDAYSQNQPGNWSGQETTVQSEDLPPLPGADTRQNSSQDFNRDTTTNRRTKSRVRQRTNSWETYRTEAPPRQNLRNRTDRAAPDERSFGANTYSGRAYDNPAYNSRAPGSLPPRRDRGSARPSRFADPGQIAGLKGDIWRGLNSKQIENLVAGLDIPPRSPSMHALWRGLWLSPARPDNLSPRSGPIGNNADNGAGYRDSRDGDNRYNRDTAGSFAGDAGPNPPRNYHDALAMEALYRSGLVGDVVDVLAQRGVGSDPLLATLQARALIGLGRRKQGCRLARQSIRPNAAMPKRLKRQALLVMGYCAAASNNASAAGLNADLAREEGVRPGLALAVMDSVANRSKPRLNVPKRMTLLDLRFLQLVSSADPSNTFGNAEPAVFGALAQDAKTKPGIRLKAAERGVRLNAVSAKTLAQVYRAQRFNRDDIADPLPTRSKPAKRRALLFQAISRARDPARKAQYIGALFKLAKREGLHYTVARMLLPSLRDLRSDRLGRFSQTATRIATLGGDYLLARRWAAGSDQGRLDHWMALIDIADPDSSGRRGADLPALADLARQKRFAAADLHRLATVLDALAYNVPIPLWQAASATPQPAKGYLPKTGVLPRLGQAAKRGQIAHSVLLAIRTIGPKGAVGAHMIALGDTIRALRRAGLERQARRLALEALIDKWPRQTRNTYTR